MTQEELVFSLLATAIGSPLLVKAFEVLMDWRKGRVSKIAALEAALNEAEETYKELEQHKQALKATHQEEVDDLWAQIRKLKEEVHRLRLALMSLGKDPDDDYIT